jgi:hypothetical protein
MTVARAKGGTPTPENQKRKRNWNVRIGNNRNRL